MNERSGHKAIKGQQKIIEAEADKAARMQELLEKLEARIDRLEN